MMEKTYISSTACRAARPRSKRLREAGGIGGGSSSTVVFNGGQGTSIITGNTHNHSNLGVLEQIGTDNSGYMWLTQLLDVPGESVATQVTEKVKAGYADKAHDLDADSPVLDKFLSRQHDDVAQGFIRFLRGLTSEQLAKFMSGAEFGSFFSNIYGGTGAAIDALGNAEVQSLKVRTKAEFMELIVNRQTAIEGDQILSESDIIESVEPLGGGRFGLHLQRKYEGYFTAFTEGAVIRGTVHNIYESAIGGPLIYYTSWMRVNMVNTVTNYIEVSTYPHNQVPSGENFIPTPLMRICRWGHQTDETRQTCIVLSTTERRILFYQHVTKPIIDPKVNIGMCLGKAPEWLKTYNQIDDNQNYLYVKGVFTEGVHNVTIYGEPVCEYVNRGPWQQGEHYCYKHKNPDTDKWEISLVYYDGCQWQCMVDGTTQEPSVRTTDWVMIVGDDTFRIDFVEPERLFEFNNFDTTLTIAAYKGKFDVTDLLPDENIGWTRYTEDASGNQRLASDTIWTMNNGGSGKQLHLTLADLDIDSAGIPKKIIFTATAQYTDGVSAVAQFQYG